jgi:hypothetical protein
MMDPVLLAHLCRLIGYLDGKTYLDLEEYMQPIGEIVDKEIELLNHRVPMPDEEAEMCGHFGNPVPDNCMCEDDCPCKQDTCKPVPLEQLPPGISPNGDGTASGMNLDNQQDEQYYHCVPCGGWHEGKPLIHGTAGGVNLLCRYCHSKIADVETRNEDRL